MVIYVVNGIVVLYTLLISIAPLETSYGGKLFGALYVLKSHVVLGFFIPVANVYLMRQLEKWQDEE